jgi:hypothetical protein
VPQPTASPRAHRDVNITSINAKEFLKGKLTGTLILFLKENPMIRTPR